MTAGAKRGRKKAEIIPALKSELSPEREFLRRCYLHLLNGDDPDPNFVRELLQRYVDLVKPKPLSGPEIAAMVDYYAMQFPSAASAIDHMAGFLRVSKAAISQHHKKYGMRAAELKIRRQQYLMDIVEIVVTDEVIEESYREVEEYNLKLEAYKKAKKDLFG